MARADFLKEMQLMMRLGRHPCLVNLLGVCTAKPPERLVLEYLPGNSLESFLNGSGGAQLRPPDYLLITHRIALGMQALAARGVIHRDLACRNILVGEQLTIKVADFGCGPPSPC